MPRRPFHEVATKLEPNPWSVKIFDGVPHRRNIITVVYISNPQMPEQPWVALHDRQMPSSSVRTGVNLGTMASKLIKDAFSLKKRDVVTTYILDSEPIIQPPTRRAGPAAWPHWYAPFAVEVAENTHLPPDATWYPLNEAIPAVQQPNQSEHVTRLGRAATQTLTLLQTHLTPTSSTT